MEEKKFDPKASGKYIEKIFNESVIPALSKFI